MDIKRLRQIIGINESVWPMIQVRIDNANSLGGAELHWQRSSCQLALTENSKEGIFTTVHFGEFFKWSILKGNVADRGLGCTYQVEGITSGGDSFDVDSRLQKVIYWQLNCCCCRIVGSYDRWRVSLPGICQKKGFICRGRTFGGFLHP